MDRRLTFVLLVMVLSVLSYTCASYNAGTMKHLDVIKASIAT